MEETKEKKEEINDKSDKDLTEEDFTEIDRDISKALIEMKKEKDLEKDNFDEEEKDLNDYDLNFFSSNNSSLASVNYFNNYNSENNNIFDNKNDVINNNSCNISYPFNINISKDGTFYSTKIEDNNSISNNINIEGNISKYNSLINNIKKDENIYPFVNNNNINIINNNKVDINNINKININTDIDNSHNSNYLNNYFINNKNSNYDMNKNTNNINHNLGINNFYEINKNINNLNYQNFFTSFSSFSVGKNKNGVNIDSPKYFIHVENILQGKDKRTTLIIRNIPMSYSISKLLRDLNKKFYHKYDVVYLPKDNMSNTNLGFGFINFIDYMHLIYFYDLFEGKKWNCINHNKRCKLAYSKYQGKDKLMEYIHKKLGIDTPFDIKDNLKNSFFINDEEKYAKPLIEIPLKYFYSFKKHYPYSLYHSKNDKIFIVDKYYNF